MALIMNNEFKKIFYYKWFCDFIERTNEKYNSFNETLNILLQQYKNSTKESKQEVFEKIEQLYINNKVFFEELSSNNDQYFNLEVEEDELQNYESKKADFIKLIGKYEVALNKLENKIMKVDSNINEKLEQEKERLAEERRRQAAEEEERRRRHRKHHDDHYDDSSSDDYKPTGILGLGIGIF